MKTNKTIPIYQDDDVTIFKCEDLWRDDYKGKFFVLVKSKGYGYFKHMVKAYTKGEILDDFGILITKD